MIKIQIYSVPGLSVLQICFCTHPVIFHYALWNIGIYISISADARANFHVHQFPICVKYTSGKYILVGCGYMYTLLRSAFVNNNDRRRAFVILKFSSCSTLVVELLYVISFYGWQRYPETRLSLIICPCKCKVPQITIWEFISTLREPGLCDFTRRNNQT